MAYFTLCMILSIFFGTKSETLLLNSNVWIKDNITFPYQLFGDVFFSRHVKCVTECGVLCTFQNCTMFEIDMITNLCSLYAGINPGKGTQPFPEGVRTIYKKEIICELSGYIYDRELRLCFKRYDDKKTWDDALISCENDGGRLIVFDSELNITTLQNRYIEGVYWIGLNDTETEGIWKWVDGTCFDSNSTSVTFNDFDQKSIENRDNADCAVLSDSGNLYDNSCDRNMSYICERPHLVSGHSL